MRIGLRVEYDADNGAVARLLALAEDAGAQTEVILTEKQELESYARGYFDALDLIEKHKEAAVEEIVEAAREHLGARLGAVLA